MNNKKWSNEELELLTFLYETKGLVRDEIYDIFKSKILNRSKESIHIKITRNKLKHNEKQTLDAKSRLRTGEKNPMFGKESCNKNLNKENSERIRIASEKISNTRKQMYNDGLLPNMSGMNNPMFGKQSWCLGLSKYTDIRLLNSGIKISKSQKEIWNLKSESEKKVIINRLNDAMMNQHKPTKIENKIADFLKSNNICFIKNYKLNGFYIDFYLTDYNIALECDGDWWHVNPKFFNRDNINSLSIAQIKSIDRDTRKNNMFICNNIKYLRFWEDDINKNFDAIKKIIIDNCK